ncbi:MAG: formate dehydrogenase subunit gamma [Hyphomicrobiales bacterium]|nr:formate dehydrogenase subunit gamma [Hyphomicrobiales bacterium]
MTAALRPRKYLAYLAALVLVAFSAALVLEIADPRQANAQSSVRPPTGATTNVTGGNVPGEALGNISDSEMWRAVRKGIKGNVSIPDKKAGQLVQSEGDNWRALKNGPLANYGAWGLLGVVVLLLLFYLLRGKIKVDHGMSGKTVTRFADLERTGHWLLAVSFIILAITGLNITYGKYFLLPVIGKSAFASLAAGGKWLHNYVAFAFMAGLVTILVLWIKENFPNAHDLKWLAQTGGMFQKGVHPPAKKFNAGQKILFWLVIWGGLGLSLTGIALMFPFQIDFPGGMEPIQQMQFMTTWHAIIALVLIIVVIAHIYIGTIGMEGAFDAMGTGKVDQNWAKEHHSIWAEEVVGSKRKKKSKSGKAAAAAE